MFDRSYTYDSVGNITAIRNFTGNLTQDFSYDHRDRLTHAWTVAGTAQAPANLGQWQAFGPPAPPEAAQTNASLPAVPAALVFDEAAQVLGSAGGMSGAGMLDGVGGPDVRNQSIAAQLAQIGSLANQPMARGPIVAQSVPPPATFVTTADATNKDDVPTTNFGTVATMDAEGGTDPDRQALMRFVVSGVTNPIVSAVVRVRVTTNDTADGPTIYRTAEGWTETGVNWNNRPAQTSGALDDRSAMSLNTWYDYDVTSEVTGNGTYSFVLVSGSTDGVVLSSREGTHPPELVVTFGSGSSPTATPTPTNTPTPTPTPIPGGGSTLVSDSFTRTVSNGWGSATTIGGTYATPGSNAADYAVNGTLGRFTITAANTNRELVLNGAGSSTAQDIDITARMAASILPVGSGAEVRFATLGRQVSTGNLYRGVVRLLADGSVKLQVQTVTGGSEVWLATGTTVSGLTVTAGSFIRVRVQMTGA